MELRLQLHLHTIESKGTRVPIESVIKPKQAVDILAKNNIDVVAVTDHNSTDACSILKEYAEKKGILVINGIEANTSDGHLIGLGIDEGIEKRLKKNMSASEVADIIRGSGGEVYIPHPFDIKKQGLGVKVKEIDGIVEVFNPMNIFGFEDKFANIVASRLKRPKAVGGDAHTPGMIGYGITVIDSELDEVSILKTLRKDKNRFENCSYMTLREMKEWSLERISLSYESIMESIRQNWDVDRWYMNIVNIRLIKVLERKFLGLGIRNKKTRFWDFITYLSYYLASFYGQLSRREFNTFISTL